MSNKNFPPSSGDSSKPVLQANTQLIKGDPGDDGRMLIADSPFIGIPCDSDNSNPVYTNAESNFYIMEGPSILAQVGNENGWALAQDSISGCTATISGFNVSIDTITADTGYVKIRAYLAGQPDLYATIFVKRVHKGVQGDQGIQGDTGAQGPQGDTGPAGSSGTSLVMLKYDITVDSPFTGTCTISDSGGNVRLTFSSDPTLVLGQVVHIYGLDTSYDHFVTITAIQGGGVYDTDLAVSSTGIVTCWDGRKLRQGGPDDRWNDIANQILYFPLVVPVGGKIDEVALTKLANGSQSAFYDVGTAIYPASGYDRWMSHRLLFLDGYNLQENLWDPTRPGYSKSFITEASSYERNLYLNVTRYSASSRWDVYFSDLELELHFSYKYFPTSWTG